LKLLAEFRHRLKRLRSSAGLRKRRFMRAMSL
jgi:hypothetical protein